MDINPTIIIDTREQSPLPITGPTLPGTLASGDYSLAGAEHWFSVERKSIPDLVQSLTTERERFTRELERLRGYRFARLLIIGTVGEIQRGEYRSRTLPKSVLHSLYSIEAKFLPVVFAPTPQDGAELVERWAWWTARAILESAKRISSLNPTPKP
jgi:DNA excision repair protein ERCC-4